MTHRRWFSLALARWLLAGTALAGIAPLPSPALAQDAGARIASIERQIRSLQDELRRVRRDLAARDADARAARADAARARAEAQRAAGQPIPSGPGAPEQATAQA